MAKIQIIIDAVDKASRELKGVNKEVQALGTGSEQASKKTGLLAGGMKTLAGAVAGYISLALAKRLIQQAVALGKLAAEAVRTERVFGNISGGAANAAENLEAMRRATRGTMSEMDMMLNASKLMQMGLATNADELERMTEMAVRLGTSMGMTATKSMDDFAMMLANKSTPRLDQFGLSSGKVRELWNELKQTMGDDEAFKLAVLEQGERALERLGDTVEDTALTIEQSEAAWADLRVEIGKRFTGALKSAKMATADFARTYADALEITREMPVAISELNRDLQNQIRIHGYTADALEKLNRLRSDYNFYLKGAQGYLWDLADRESAAADAVTEHSYALNDAAPIYKSNLEIQAAAAARYQGQADAAGIAASSIYETEKATKEAGDAAEEAAAKHELQRKALADSAEAAGSLAMSLKDATEKQIAQELIGMLDPEEMGATAYTGAVREIGRSFDLMDEKSIALAENLPRLAEALQGGVIPAQEADEALAALVADAEDGVVQFGDLLGQFDQLPGMIAEANSPLNDMETALEPLPGLTQSTASGIAATGANAAGATPQLRDYNDELERMSRISSHTVPAAMGGPTPIGPSGEFQSGGIVPGPPGKPQLIIAHGGEEIIPAHQVGYAAEAVPPSRMATNGGGRQVVVNVNNHFSDTVFLEDDAALTKLANRMARATSRSIYSSGAIRRQ